MSFTKRSKNKLPPFVALSWTLLNSKAYCDLKPSAAKALPYFLGKPKLPFNNPDIHNVPVTFSYSESNRYGFANATFSSVIVDLVEKGFIDPVEKGGLRSDAKTYNKFKLSKRWEKYQTAEFQSVRWKEFVSSPKQKATSKSEAYSSKIGSGLPQNRAIISQNEAVGTASS